MSTGHDIPAVFSEEALEMLNNNFSEVDSKMVRLDSLSQMTEAQAEMANGHQGTSGEPSVEEPMTKEQIQEFIANNGMMLPRNFNSMTYQQKKLWANQGKPNLGKVYFSILFENGKRQFGISSAKSNFNESDFEAEKLRAFPKSVEVTRYITEEIYKAEMNI